MGDATGSGGRAEWRELLVTSEIEGRNLGGGGEEMKKNHS